MIVGPSRPAALECPARTASRTISRRRPCAAAPVWLTCSLLAFAAADASGQNAPGQDPIAAPQTIPDAAETGSDGPAGEGFALPDADEPILVDAAEASVDRRNDKLVFTDIRITQGSLSVAARVAQGTGLSFENSDWTFSEDVRLASAAGALIEADEAQLTFRGNALVLATLTGTPVTFERESLQVPGERSRGRAERVDYDVQAGTIRLSGGAWVCHSGSEFISEVIVYEIAAERVLTDSGESGGRVKILIQPNSETRDAQGCGEGPTVAAPPPP